MTYWESVASRLSIPGIALLAIGALVCFDAPQLSALVFKEGGDRAALPMKVAGLLMAVLGTLILLDVIPI